MIEWLTILLALAIIVTLVSVFGYLAWNINMAEPLTGDESKQHSEASGEKKRKEKNVSEQGKKKRKEQKKTKRDNKDDEQSPTKAKGATTNTSEETDDESEQEFVNVPSQTTDTSSKARKRNKNKAQPEADAKNATTTRAPPATHLKSASKDELETSKQQPKAQAKSAQVPSSKPVASTPTTTASKKPAHPVEDDLSLEQPFTVVGGNRQKAPTQPSQQHNKPPTTATPTPAAPVKQTPTVQPQQEQLAKRQPAPQKQTPAPATPSAPAKQQPAQSATKVADLIKVLPSSQLVITELMTGLDAYPLSADELDIIMQKIANKQSVLNKDWSKLQLGQKVDPQAHIGQVMDVSDKAYTDDMKNNSGKRMKELTDELNAEKRRSHELLKEKLDKERENQTLHAQLDSANQKSGAVAQPQQQQQKVQVLEAQLKRMTEENAHLSQQLAQQQHSTASNLSSTGDKSNLQLQLLSEQMKKLSVDNANWEKKAKSNELLAKEAQKEKEDLTRYNEQLTQSLQTAEQELKSIEAKHHHQLNDTKRRVEQLESENEQLRREDIVHVEPSSPTHIQTMTVNNEEREQFEKEIAQLKQAVDANQSKGRDYEEMKRKLTAEVEEQKKKIDDLQGQRRSQENELRQEVDRLKNDQASAQRQADESRNEELRALRTELDQVKSKSEEQLRHERDNQRKVLANLLAEDLRNQLPHDNQDFNQWLTSYRQVFETNKRNSQEEAAALKRENEQLHKNITDVENQLKEIEQTVQSKEETLLSELQSKDSTMETIRTENEQLTGELQRLREEIQRLHSVHDASSHEVRALKHQLDERFLLAGNSPAVTADESFELVKQPSPSLSPIVIDIRAEQLNELIRSSKEALENQDTITQQLDKHLNDIHPSGQGEASASSSTVSSNQQS